MILVDGHQDLAWNMLTFQRDYTRPAAETRRLEKNTLIPQQNGDTLLGWPDYQQGRVAVIFATLFAAPARRRLGEWDHLVYVDTQQARKIYSRQLDAYHRLVDQHHSRFRLIERRADLAAVLDHWENQPDDFGPVAAQMEDPGEAERIPEEERPPKRGHPVGLVVLMEGAEAIGEPAELEDWWGRGVRIVGPAWVGTRFCGGTGEPGPLTKEGYALLESMADFGFTLDISHMDQKAALQAIDSYAGKIIASHSNMADLLDLSSMDARANRFLPERVVRALLERDGMIGVVPYIRFLDRSWAPSRGRQAVTLQHVADHIDYICQMAGDARHAAIGTDFDGGFGLQSAPGDVDTIADLQKLAPILQGRGYSEEDTALIFGQNWIRTLQETLPETP